MKNKKLTLQKNKPHNTKKHGRSLLFYIKNSIITLFTVMVVLGLVGCILLLGDILSETYGDISTDTDASLIDQSIINKIDSLHYSSDNQSSGNI